MRDHPFLAGGACLLALLFASNVYRAANQSIVHDEALTYQLFLAGPSSLMFDSYDANHHVLHTYLCKVSVSVFGLSELSMRLPSLLGGALYLALTFLISRYLFGDGWLFLLSTAFLSLHPLLLDLLSAARGYGMAVGFWLLSLYYLFRCLCEDVRLKWLYIAAAGGALSVASNLTLLYVNVACGLVFLFALTRRAPAPPARKKHRGPDQGSAALRGLLHFALPAALLAWLIVSPPLSHATKDQFYAGATSLYQGAASLIEGVLGKLAGATPAVVGGLVPAVLGVAAFFAWRTQRDRRWPWSRIDACFLLIGGAVPVLLILLLVGHYGFDLPYPEGRTALYWIPLFGLASLAIASRFPAFAVLPAVCALLFALRFDLGYYRAWAYDGAARRMMEQIGQQPRAGPVRIGATWQLEPALNFYRVMRDYGWIDPIRRQSPAFGTYDYYALWNEDRALVEKLRLTPLLNDPKAGTVLARKVTPTAR
ncbi:MAG: glycosyltransferase family 39 protein [Candidatus Solibacter usitatus]|nr:glycosyltransferase family 39 protein [Candidatus Solibacter usitatus]